MSIQTLLQRIVRISSSKSLNHGTGNQLNDSYPNQSINQLGQRALCSKICSWQQPKIFMISIEAPENERFSGDYGSSNSTTKIQDYTIISEVHEFAWEVKPSRLPHASCRKDGKFQRSLDSNRQVDSNEEIERERSSIYVHRGLPKNQDQRPLYQGVRRTRWPNCRAIIYQIFF
jgi:hypothetical protein